MKEIIALLSATVSGEGMYWFLSSTAQSLAAMVGLGIAGGIYGLQRIDTLLTGAMENVRDDLQSAGLASRVPADEYMRLDDGEKGLFKITTLGRGRDVIDPLAQSNKRLRTRIMKRGRFAGWFLFMMISGPIAVSFSLLVIAVSSFQKVWGMLVVGALALIVTGTIIGLGVAVVSAVREKSYSK